jgi:coenzyme F420 hydrogenase subunit beta
VRTETGQKLIDLARQKGVLEFREVPQGNLDRLKKASLRKKKAGEEKLKTLDIGKK